jgi:hypothetical protein
MRRMRAIVFALIMALAMPATAVAEEPTRLLWGTVTARFTGQPVAGACVSVIDEARNELGRGCADSAGNYEIHGTFHGSHRIKTSAPGYADTWLRSDYPIDARDFETAHTQFIDGRRYDLGLRSPGIGAIAGKLTYDGAPVGSAEVTFVDEDVHHWGLKTWTDKDGNYAFRDLSPGHYTLQYRTDHGTQYYHQKTTLSAADVVTVASYVETVVDEQLFPPGFIDLTAVNSANGQPVTEFCGSIPRLEIGPLCTTNGSLRLKSPPGAWDLWITSEPAYFGTWLEKVQVKSNEATATTAKLQPGVAIRTTVRDATSGQPVANTCVEPVDVAAHGLSVWSNQKGWWCSDNNGAVTLEPLRVSAYRLFARPGDDVHGMQWVGDRGGTGKQEDARRVEPAPGTVAVVPDINLDGAGTVVGTVRAEATGQPIQQAYVFPYASDGAGGDVYTDRNGQYKLKGMGPYAWPIEFVAMGEDYGWRWSGNAEHRLAATPAIVRVGEDVTADASLQPSAKITGTVTGLGSVSVRAFNAVTGDWAGPHDSGSQYTLGGLGTQQVKIRFRDFSSGQEVWYRDAASARDAQVIQVRSGETISGIDQSVG